uniref:FtsW/RodA/SpoVE family cell cycle protein n=1 Tax=Vaginimicrobium propionicum TaxID=1871034 RepID=UPI0009705C4F|nr:FtsW/RodA/SpoVE family cell cycle protein [Vaginimicrobium propionicum]
MSGNVIVYRKRRNIELVGIIFAILIGAGATIITHLFRDGALPKTIIYFCIAWAVICLGAHLSVRKFASFADPAVLPIVLTLNGLGLAMIHRLDMSLSTSQALSQFIWTIAGIVLFSLVLALLKDYRRLDGLSYVLFIAGMILLLLPLVPFLASPMNVQNGSQIWISVAGYSFQPAELAKIVLAIAFASYLAEHRDLLTLAGPRIGKIQFPRMRDLVPVIIMWAAALVVLVFENDLGTSLLFFGLFIMLLYVATNQLRWIIISLAMFIFAAIGAMQLAHVRTRISSWLDPFSDFDTNYQIIQAQYGMAWGGLFGRGLGLGRPQQIPVASSDFISAAIGEELGLAGLMALILLYLLLVSRGMRSALIIQDDFGKLLAAGFSFVFGLQTFAIIGGVTRLLPLTGLTTPFVSQGGSSLVCNWVIIGIIMVISHCARRPKQPISVEPIADLEDEKTQLIKVASDE